MQRLTGLDAAFLSIEVPSAPMHVASIIVLDPSTVEGGVGMPQLRALYEKRVHLAPPFRRRLVEVPFGIHHPIWIEDPDFDLDFHLRHIAVPAPGTMNELSELAGHLVAMPLDRRRPLWEVWLITGLEDGNVAVLTKVHHAAIDGASGEELMIAILDLTPEIEEKPMPDEPWVPDRVPNDTELFSYAVVSLAQSPLKMLKATRRTLEAAFWIRQKNRQRGTTAPPPSVFSAPRTSFNHPLTPRRHVATASLSLPDVKMIKNAFGVTVNDVILTICGGAVRHYLDGIEEETDRALVAMVPVSVRTEDKKGTMGNEVSATLTTLATDIDDPLERLMVVSSGMRRSKEQFNAIGADTLQNWTEFAAPAVLGRAARLYSRMRVADVHRPLFNLLVSNVPGPPFPLYIAGGQVKAVYPIGPIYNGIGLNITVMSYLDSLDFGINTCPELVPEPWRLTDGLHLALEDLKKLAEAERAEAERADAEETDAVEPAPAPAPGTPAADPLPGTPITVVAGEAGPNGAEPKPAPLRPAARSAKAASRAKKAATAKRPAKKAAGTRKAASRAPVKRAAASSRSTRTTKAAPRRRRPASPAPGGAEDQS